MKQLRLLIFSFIFSIGLLTSTAIADTLTLNHQNYVFGDTIVVSGKLSYNEGKFIGLQIINPSKSDIVLIDQFFPQKDGSFSKAYKAQGPKWYEEGQYSVKVVYDDQAFEKKFGFQKKDIVTIEPNPEQSKSPQSGENTNSQSVEDKSQDPKLRVPGFPDPNNSPKYYLERYETEPKYQDWFDKEFPDYSISTVVGYKNTQVPGFPDEDNSPWYYVNRYNQEEAYRDWFDSQFPTKSIFDVLGYPESFFQKVPEWVKNNAGWWASDLITDSDFLNGITYLINEKILIVSQSNDPTISSTQTIPVWVKNTAGWWADGKIDENEFLKGIQFLVENGIIKV